jgi:sterol 14-demethylase
MVTYSEVLLSILIILTATITGNMLRQLLQRSPHEPPLVFYWVPVIGSTIAYGIDPFKFFLKCKAEVGLSESDP